MDPPFDPEFPPWHEDLALFSKASPRAREEQESAEYKQLAADYDVTAPDSLLFDEKRDVEAAIAHTQHLQSILYQNGGGYQAWVVDTATLCLVGARNAMINDVNITAFIYPITDDIVKYAKKKKREVAADLVAAMRKRMTHDPRRSRVSATPDDNVMVVWQRIDPEEPETNRRLLLIWEAKVARYHRFNRAKHDDEVCFSCLAQRGLRLVQSCCTCARSLWIKMCQLYGAHVPDGITEAQVREYIFEHKRRQAQDARTAAQIEADASPIPTKTVAAPQDDDIES